MVPMSQSDIFGSVADFGDTIQHLFEMCCSSKLTSISKNHQNTNNDGSRRHDNKVRVKSGAIVNVTTMLTVPTALTLL